MPEGQFTGARKSYIYVADSDENYIISTDATLGDLAGTGLVAANSTNAAGLSDPPGRFKPRGVHWQGVLGGRIVRKFIITNTGDTATLYSAGGVTALTIDGVPGNTTGHRGETQSYRALPATAAR